MKFTDWLKGKLDAHLSPDPELSFRDPEPEEIEDEDGPPVVTARFKVTTEDNRTLFVYGCDEAEARSRLPESLSIASFEPAGHAENGVIHFPPEELSEVMASMQDGRRAPGA
jgi:hypothetical protein